MSEFEQRSTDILVIGSGAGGAVVAATLAEAGREVLVIEEGPDVKEHHGPRHTPDAVRRLYRNRGVTPIMGPASIAFVEGRCVGGSTEINSGFWHRPPEAALQRWSDVYAVRDLAPAAIDRILDEIESELQIATTPRDRLPESSQVFKQGADRMGWAVEQIPRVQAGDSERSQFASDDRRSMSRTYLPRAIAAGAQILSGCRASKIHHRSGRVTDVTASRRRDGESRPLVIRARHVFVCGGPIQTPALLRSSGIKRNVGDNLRIHPMVKVVAQFPQIVDGHRAAIPVFQTKVDGSAVFLGGSVNTPGFLAMTLADRWPANQASMRHWRHMAAYYASCRGENRGSVRVLPWGDALSRYRLSMADRATLTVGLSRLCELLFAGGAIKVFPGVRNAEPLSSADDARHRFKRPLPAAAMTLSTVHATSTCPIGERSRLCAADSWGRLHGFSNLFVAGASMIPDAPGVNPQATVMALALRAARRFLDHRPS